MQTQQLHINQPFTFESGETISSLDIAYNTYGTYQPEKNNVIWVCHAFTGNSDVFDWWGGLFGEKDFFNPADYFIVCANIIGSCYGSTGPLSINPDTGKPYGHSFPLVTVRDMVKAHKLLADHLEIQQIKTVIGVSLGGQQALEFIIQHPTLIDNLIIAATNAVHSPWGIGFNEAQRMAIAADSTWETDALDAGMEGMRAARSIALLSYRSYKAYGISQQEENNDKIDNYKAASYQQYQGEKLKNRFNAYAYWTLSKAMDSQNIGRGKVSIPAVLQSIRQPSLVIGIDSDGLFPAEEQQLIAEHIPNSTYHEITSTYGHDGFLIETKKLTQVISDFYNSHK